MDIQSLKNHLEKHGQNHLLQFWDSLDSSQQQQLVGDLERINIPEVVRYFNATIDHKPSQKLDARMEPIPEEQYSSTALSNKDQLKTYKDIGLKGIREGKVASLLLAGGQGTRLGVNYPKGMYDVGLPSRKTLFQIQAERLQKIKELAGASNNGSIPWYIMTSEGTSNATIEYFKKNNYFGLNEKDVIVFEQGMLPAFTFDGKIILETKHKIAKAPDGNGGLYKALKDQGILQDMKSRGIEYVHVYCVDNILVKMVDPIFLGYCINKGADAGAKVVEKIIPTEPVGVFCKVDGKYQVVEYSEITSQTSEEKNPSTGRLLFNAGNICNHFFTVSFLDKLLSGLENTLIHHIAKKKISHIDESGNLVNPKVPNGVKLEKFVFDVFQFTDKFAVWEVPREEDFSPLKNSNSESKDTPLTCKNDLFINSLQHLLEAGAKFDSMNDLNNNNTPIVEISPLVSYAGEGLQFLVNNFGQDLKTPLLVIKKGEKLPMTEKLDQINVIEL